MDNPQHAAVAPPRRESPSLEQRLILEEKNLAEAFLRRTKMLGEIAQRRKLGRRTAADPNLEKSLWGVWEKVLQREGIKQQRPWRTLVAQNNSLAYALSEERDRPGSHSWTLSPRATNRPVTLHGPTDIFTTRIMTFWAALSDVQVTLQGPVLNDGLVELIKALNQAGARLSWDDNAVISRPSSEHFAKSKDWDQKAIHAGQHSSTLALVLARALGNPGIVKVSGSGKLNMLDLKPWHGPFSQLGARLHQLNPYAPGLPVRLESSGHPQHAHLGPDTPQEILWALLVSAPFYPEGLRLTWPTEFLAGHEFHQALLLLQSAGVPLTAQPGGVTITASPPAIREHIPLPLDPGLCAVLLGWSRLTGQAVTLLGCWPEKSPAARQCTDLLCCLGVDINTTPDFIRASPGKWPRQPTLDVRTAEQYAPLAVILALCAPMDVIILSEQALDELDIVDALLRFTGRSCIRDGLRHRFHEPAQEYERETLALEAPDAFWGMAMALLSFARPGLTLINPGELTTVWPRFWNVFHSVLSFHRPNPEPPPTEIADVKPAQRRRRVRI